MFVQKKLVKEYNCSNSSSFVGKINQPPHLPNLIWMALIKNASYSKKDWMEEKCEDGSQVVSDLAW